MKLTINPELERLIEERMKSGRYASPEELIAAALGSLERDEQFGDFEPGEWDDLLAEGEASGEPLDAEAVFTELRNLGPRRRDEAQ